MLTKNVYPKCYKSFRQWCISTPNANDFYYSLGPPKLFDVTLRDGLQSLSKEEQTKFTTIHKIEMYKEILLRHNINNIELGSVVSEKILPIFKDSIQFCEAIHCYQQPNKTDKTEQVNNYLLVSNKEKMKKVINKTYINNFAFITSVSNSFQFKNTKMSLEQSDQDILNILYELDENKDRVKLPNVKLYVSCINECPVEGKIDNDFIVYRLLNLNKLNIENLCLSDTCGTLEVDDFEYIIETCLFFGLRASILSLHLHVKPGR